MACEMQEPLGSCREREEAPRQTDRQTDRPTGRGPERDQGAGTGSRVEVMEDETARWCLGGTQAAGQTDSGDCGGQGETRGPALLLRTPAPPGPPPPPAS